MTKRSLVPFLTHISDLENFFDDFNFIPTKLTGDSGVSVSEDDTHVYVEAHLPGIKKEEVKVSFEKGILSIQGENKEEKKNRRYARKAVSSFSYRVSVGGYPIDEAADIKADFENGVLHVTFAKSKASTPRKIEITAKK